LHEAGDTTEAEYARLTSNHASRLAKRDRPSAHRLLLSQMLRMSGPERPSVARCLEAVAILAVASASPTTTSRPTSHEVFAIQKDQPIDSRSSDSQATALASGSHAGTSSPTEPGSSGSPDTNASGADRTRRLARSEAPSPESPGRGHREIRVLRLTADDNYSHGGGSQAWAPTSPSASVARKRHPSSGSGSGFGSTGSDRHASKRQATYR
jgi:hypothetical protein